MSAPRCKTCKYFNAYPITNDGYGECRDDSKLIYSCYGIQSETDYPETNENNTCSNHETAKVVQVVEVGQVWRYGETLVFKVSEVTKDVIEANCNEDNLYWKGSVQDFLAKFERVSR